MSYYTKAIELEKKLKEVKAAQAKLDKVNTYMITKRNELLFSDDGKEELNRTLDDVRSILYNFSIDFNRLISKLTKLTDKAWFDFYAQEYEEEGEEEND